jgi:3-oxoacyl-[acyl-carrier protein] reductase
MNTKDDMSLPAIFITGTSRGIGLHLAEQFLQDGYRVIGVSRRAAPIVHEAYRHVIADMADQASIQGLRDVIADGPIRGLINNVGIHGPIGPFEDTPMDAWIRAFHVNLFGAATLTQLCIPQLRAQHGFIIFLSGGGAAFPRPRFTAYGVSKTAVVRLAEVLAQELAPEIRVHCIAPGPNKTALLEEAIEAGTDVPDDAVVGFDDPVRLCRFLADTTDERYSGKFIHVKDDYREWPGREMPDDAYTLRRIKA